jgi:hypothetical protein
MQLVNGVPQKNIDVVSKNKNFLTSAPRFNADATTKKEAIPGPGHYSVENAATWFKRSYNMNFSEM